MDTPTLINLVGVAVTAVATVTLAVLTGRYVRLTHALVEETKAAKEPNVYIDLEFGGFGATLVIGNSGSKPALNVAFVVDDKIPWRPMQDQPPSMAELDVVKHGISYLAPGRVLKYQAGHLPHDREVFNAKSVLDVQITYQSEGGAKHQRRSVIGLGQYSGVLVESFADPTLEVARAIKDTESRRRSSESLASSIRTRMGKKACPTCGELVASSARKCPHCLEFIGHDNPQPEKQSEPGRSKSSDLPPSGS